MAITLVSYMMQQCNFTQSMHCQLKLCMYQFGLGYCEWASVSKWNVRWK